MRKLIGDNVNGTNVNGSQSVVPNDQSVYGNGSNETFSTIQNDMSVETSHYEQQKRKKVYRNENRGHYGTLASILAAPISSIAITSTPTTSANTKSTSTFVPQPEPSISGQTRHRETKSISCQANLSMLNYKFPTTTPEYLFFNPTSSSFPLRTSPEINILNNTNESEYNRFDRSNETKNILNKCF